MVFKPKTKQQHPKNGVLQKYIVTHLNTTANKNNLVNLGSDNQR